MIKGVYAIQDRLSGFLSPVVDDSDEQAIRNFEHTVLTSGSLLDSHSADYCLYRLGWFDTLSGGFLTQHPSDSSLVPIVALMPASSVVQRSASTPRKSRSSATRKGVVNNDVQNSI